jgi:hypothetical protein
MLNLITTGIPQVSSGDRMRYRATDVSDSAPNASNKGPISLGRRDPFPVSCTIRHGMTAQLLPFLLFQIFHGVSRWLSDFWFSINLVLARTSPSIVVEVEIISVPRNSSVRLILLNRHMWRANEMLALVVVEYRFSNEDPRKVSWMSQT